jgi:hypothetical protein
MSAHWPVNDGEDRSGTIPGEGMARWTVVFSAYQLYPLQTRNTHILFAL